MILNRLANSSLRLFNIKEITIASRLIGIRCSSTTRLYTEKHEWILIKDKQIGRVGISNHAQEALGDVVYVQLPEVGSKYKQFTEVGVIESVKAASDLITPVSGEVTSINEQLSEKPGLINSDCHEEGWLFEIKLDDQKELDQLMDQDKYSEFLKKLD